MLNRGLLLLSILLLFSCAVPAELPSDIDHGTKLSLWKIESQDAQIYLLGSIHVLKPEYYPLPKPIQEAYLASDHTVFEIDLAKISSVEITEIMQKLGSYQANRTVVEDLSPQTMTLLKEYIETNHLQSAGYLRFKPWMISLQVTMLEMSKSGFRANLGIDQHFQIRARRDGKEIHQLETFKKQIELIAGDSMSLQEGMLKETLLDVESIPTLIDELVLAWQNGNADEMYRISTRDQDKHPELEAQMARLLDDRNIAMAEKIKGFLEGEGSYFVVVGALHMGGPKGLLELLGAKYQIRQIQE